MYSNYFIDLFSSEILAILLSTNSKSNKVFDWSIDWLILLHVIGEEAIEIYNTFQCTTEEDRIKLDVLKSKFDEYVNPRKNTVFERYRTLTICMENPEIPWRIQMQRFIPVEIFRKKSNTFRGITLFPFSPKRPKFSVPFVEITSARLHVERKRKIYRYFVMIQLNPVPVFRTKKIPVLFDGKFSPKFPHKW